METAADDACAKIAKKVAARTCTCYISETID